MQLKIDALLVKLNISVFNNSRQDREMTEEMKTMKKLGKDAGKWVKYKLPESCFDGVKEVRSAAHRFFYESTLFWEDGRRLLLVKNRSKFDKQMEAFGKEFDQAVKDFVKRYPKALSDAKSMHNGTYNPADYPEDIGAEFSFRCEHFPIPNASHFDGELGKAYGNEIEKTNAQSINDAMSDVWNRMLIPVKKMADTLADPESIFRDSIVENIREMLTTIPALNIMGDDRMSKAVSRIRTNLAKLDPEALRAKPVLRKEAVKAANEIIKSFGQMGQRKIIKD